MIQCANCQIELTAERVLELEHDLYPRALKLIAKGSVRWSSGFAANTGDVDNTDIIRLATVS